MTNLAEELSSLLESKSVYDKAVETFNHRQSKTEGVIETIDTNIVDNRAKLEKCVKDINLLKKSAQILEQYSNDVLSKMYADLSAMLTSNFASVNGSEIIIEERTQSNGKSVLDIYIKDNGVKREIKADCGHGIGQLVSLFLTCSIVSNSGKNKVMLLDEVVSGVSSSNLVIVDKVISYMHEKGFTVVINEHGFVPSNSTVYTLEKKKGVSSCIKTEFNEVPIYREISL